MKNRLFTIAFSLFLSGSLMAQQGGRIGSHDAVSWKPVTVPTNSFASPNEGRNIGQQIIDVVGLSPNFEIREANVPNAAAVTYNGKRYVLYNPNFINQLERSTGTRWAGISVLAHEIGHHLNGHTITASGSQPALELQADEFSGFVLRKMGASLADAQAAMKTIASSTASATHPARYDRLTSIADGWNKADAQITGRPYVKSNPAPRPVEPVASTPQRRQATTSVLGRVRFNADPSTAYYVTNSYNLVRVRNNQAAVIGKLTASNNRRYPYIISDNSTQLYVDAYGNILNTSGRSVGKLTPGA